MPVSTNGRSLELLRKLGMECQTVEQWVRFPGMRHGIRRDLFNFADIVALGEEHPGCLFVQSCAGASHAARLDKIYQEQKARKALNCGNTIWVCSWKKKKPRGEKRPRWHARVTQLRMGGVAGEIEVQELEF